MDNATVLAFKAISGFIADLTAEFGSKMKSIVLYNRLLEKTGLVHTKPILKHVECFRTFFRENVAAMEQRKPSAFVNPKISYSDRVYLDISVIFRESPRDSVEIIWRHLYAIWGLVDPSSQARRLLAETMKQGGDSAGKESDFLSSIIDKVEKTVKSGDVDASNPMGAVSKLMSSGVFTDLIQGMQTGLSDGSLNIGKLMGSVQGLMGKMGGGGGSSGAGAGGGMPDLNAMMSMIGPMMSGMSGMSSGAAEASSSSSSQSASSKDAPDNSEEKKE